MQWHCALCLMHHTSLYSLKFICSELGTRQAEIRFSSVRPLRLANALLAPTGYFTRLKGGSIAVQLPGEGVFATLDVGPCRLAQKWRRRAALLASSRHPPSATQPCPEVPQSAAAPPAQAASAEAINSGGPGLGAMPAAAAASPLLERGALIGEQHGGGYSGSVTPLQIGYRLISVWSDLLIAMTNLHPINTCASAPEACLEPSAEVRLKSTSHTPDGSARTATQGPQLPNSATLRCISGSREYGHNCCTGLLSTFSATWVQCRVP